jgi:hypothetical protein
MSAEAAELPAAAAGAPTAQRTQDDAQQPAPDVAEAAPPGAVLGLPPPPPRAAGDAAPHSLDMSSGHCTVSLDVLGPVIVGLDGTLSRIGNWAELTPAEREVTQRRIAERNNTRLAHLRVRNDPLD